MELYLTERLGAPVFFISGAVAKAIEDDVEREGGIICGWSTGTAHLLLMYILIISVNRAEELIHFLDDFIDRLFFSSQGEYLDQYEVWDCFIMTIPFMWKLGERMFLF